MSDAPAARDERRPWTPPLAGPEPASRRCPKAGSLPLRTRLAQTLFVGHDGSSPAALRRLATRPHPPGGVFLTGTATAALRSGVLRRLARAPRAPLVAVDEEGGRVQRIDRIAGDLPDARQLGRKSQAAIRKVATRRGRQLVRLGVTMDFAPVVDVGRQPADAVIGDRAFAARPHGVTAKAGAFADGLRRAGVLPTLKHFPGHGRAAGDSHRRLPVTPRWSSMQKVDVRPYRRLTHDGPVAVMVGHLAVPGLTPPGLPSSLDADVYRYLRRDLRFPGLVVTDDLSLMRAVADRYNILSASRRALAAGADMVLVADGVSVGRILDALVADVRTGRLSQQRVTAAAARVLRAKGC